MWRLLSANCLSVLPCYPFHVTNSVSARTETRWHWRIISSSTTPTYQAIDNKLPFIPVGVCENCSGCFHSEARRFGSLTRFCAGAGNDFFSQYAEGLSCMFLCQVKVFFCQLNGRITGRLHMRTYIGVVERRQFPHTFVTMYCSRPIDTNTCICRRPAKNFDHVLVQAAGSRHTELCTIQPQVTRLATPSCLCLMSPNLSQ